MAQVQRSQTPSPAVPALDCEPALSRASGSPAYHLQQMLVQRLQGEGDWMNAVSDSRPGLVDQLDDMASRISRLAGPVLFVAAAAGMVALLL